MLRCFIVSASVLVIAPVSAGATSVPFEIKWDAPVRTGFLSFTLEDSVMIEAQTGPGVFSDKSAAIAFYGFDLAGGQRTPADLDALESMVWRFDGWLKFRRGGRTRLTVDRFAVDAKRRRITARVAGRRMTVAVVVRKRPPVPRNPERITQRVWNGPFATSTKFRAIVKRRMGKAPSRRWDGLARIVLPSQPVGGPPPPDCAEC